MPCNRQPARAVVAILRCRIPPATSSTTVRQTFTSHQSAKKQLKIRGHFTQITLRKKSAGSVAGVGQVEVRTWTSRGVGTVTAGRSDSWLRKRNESGRMHTTVGESQGQSQDEQVAVVEQCQTQISGAQAVTQEPLPKSSLRKTNI